MLFITIRHSDELGHKEIRFVKILREKGLQKLQFQFSTAFLSSFLHSRSALFHYATNIPNNSSHILFIKLAIIILIGNIYSIIY